MKTNLINFLQERELNFVNHKLSRIQSHRLDDPNSFLKVM